MTVDLTKSWDFSPLEMVWEPESLPKKKKLAKTQEELKVTMEQLAVKKADLKAVEDELAGLEAAFNEATAKKEQLEEDVELCEKKLTRAKQLIDGLGGEQSRHCGAALAMRFAIEEKEGNLVGLGQISFVCCRTGLPHFQGPQDFTGRTEFAHDPGPFLRREVCVGKPRALAIVAALVDRAAGCCGVHDFALFR